MTAKTIYHPEPTTSVFTVHNNVPPHIATAALGDYTTPIPGENYGTLPIVGPPTGRPAAEHGDINLSLRGYVPTIAALNLIDVAGPSDPRTPQLPGLFRDKRTPVIRSVYRTYHWDWVTNSRGKPDAIYKVSVVGLAVALGETIHVPDAGYEIGQGYDALVLYADRERMTLKYTGEDSLVNGYTIHVENVYTEPTLLALYEQMNAEGRGQLPVLRAGQAFGRARGNEIGIAVRDGVRFLDPRIRKDWWRGR